MRTASAPLNIAFFGSSLASSYWNGAATYYRAIISELSRRGNRVTLFEPGVFEGQQYCDIDDPDVVVYQPTDDGMQSALEAAYGADVLVKASGVGILDTELEAAVLEGKASHTTVVYWDADAPATLSSMRNPVNPNPLRPLVPRYDMVLTYGGGEPAVRKYIQLGAQECHAVYNALDPLTHYPVQPSEAFAGNLGLLANRLPEQEARIGEFFLKPASLLPGKSFILGGNGWQDAEMPENVRMLGHVYTCDHNAFNCSPLAVLNISRESMATNGYSPATRVFEAAGSGACLITDYWEGIELFLEPGKEILVASDGDEVAEILTGLTSERARSIGLAALRRVNAQHTYHHRAALVESLLMGRRPVLENAL